VLHTEVLRMKLVVFTDEEHPFSTLFAVLLKYFREAIVGTEL